MASLLYFISCGTLTALAIVETQTRNRIQRLQRLFTLLCALVFCGIFALLVQAAQLGGGRYRGLSTLAMLLLTSSSLLVVARTARRFRPWRPAEPLPSKPA